MMMTTSHISTKVTSQIDVGMHGVGASMYSSMLNRMATGCRFFFLGDLVRSEWVCRDLGNAHDAPSTVTCHRHCHWKFLVLPSQVGRNRKWVGSTTSASHRWTYTSWSTQECVKLRENTGLGHGDADCSAYCLIQLDRIPHIPHVVGCNYLGCLRALGVSPDMCLAAAVQSMQARLCCARNFLGDDALQTEDSSM
jgi:hypothetical protein